MQIEFLTEHLPQLCSRLNAESVMLSVRYKADVRLREVVISATMANDQTREVATLMDQFRRLYDPDAFLDSVVKELTADHVDS